MTETTKLPLSIGQKRLVYQDRNQKVYKAVAHFDGFSKEYFVSDHGERAAVLVVNNGKVLICRQYRLLINDISYEISGGRIDEGESPNKTAIRECLEETGVIINNIIPLISFHSGLDIHRCYTYVYFSKTVIDESNKNTNRKVWIPLEQCIDMIFSGNIVDSLSIIAILAYHTKINKL